MTKRVNVQNVFNKVIDAGIYGDTSYEDRIFDREPFMCHALYVANTRGIITEHEYSVAYTTINEYINDVNYKYRTNISCMCNALSSLGKLNLLDCNQGLPKKEHTREGSACTALYRNWYRRPKVK